MRNYFILGLLIIFIFTACSKKENPVDIAIQPELQYVASASTDKTNEQKYKEKLQSTLLEARIPDTISNRIISAKQDDFLTDFENAIKGDPFLRILVDKQHKLPDNYIPQDLVSLDGNHSYKARSGSTLRKEAEASLEEMAQAALKEGITLLASSTYRSYTYQIEVYNRNVRENGKETADRESARPGHSQHQLGLIVDFGSITDAYADTAAGKWLLKNASKFGWSLSFPDGYEDITGYRWECWHYRYVGKPLAAFIDKWFDGIQQYALQFIYVWENEKL